MPSQSHRARSSHTRADRPPCGGDRRPRRRPTTTSSSSSSASRTSTSPPARSPRTIEGRMAEAAGMLRSRRRSPARLRWSAAVVVYLTHRRDEVDEDPDRRAADGGARRVRREPARARRELARGRGNRVLTHIRLRPARFARVRGSRDTQAKRCKGAPHGRRRPADRPDGGRTHPVARGHRHHRRNLDPDDRADPVRGRRRLARASSSPPTAAAAAPWPRATAWSSARSCASAKSSSPRARAARYTRKGPSGQMSGRPFLIPEAFRGELDGCPGKTLAANRRCGSCTNRNHRHVERRWRRGPTEGIPTQRA